MYATGFATALAWLVLEMFVDWTYGPVAVLGLALFAIGVRHGNSTCASLGAVILALTLMQPAA
ncbi:hypothetical protein [Streptomyces sp. NPDC060194]|uniref:hypothetical protein n=1 Tax=Streptomyces sp. NPDC060194 TaxID=3347069 RepID=UPI00365C89E5